MNPQVTLSDDTYADLQKLAEPFVDKTPEDVIIRLIQGVKAGGQPATPAKGAKEFGANAPHLGHTKMLVAKLNGVPIEQANWNRLLDSVILEAAKTLQNPQKLRELIIVNAVEGPKDKHGYRFLPAAGLSVQGQDSNGAWKAIAHLAKAMKFTVEVVFVWLQNPKAANPGETGRLSVAP